MANICDRCNVFVEEGHLYCPLCGRNLSTQNNIISIVNRRYPNYKRLQQQKIKAARLMALLLIVATVLTVFIDLVITKTISFSGFVLAGAAFTWLTVLLPIQLQFNVATNTIVSTVAIMLLIFSIDMLTGYGGWSVQYIMPFVISVNVILSAILIFTKGYMDISFLSPITASLIISIPLFFINFAGEILWPSIMCLALSVGLFVFLLFFRFKKVKSAVSRKFRI